MLGPPTFGSAVPAGLSGTNTGDVTIGAFGAVPNAFGLSITGQALSLQPATATQPGAVSAAAQVFGGLKDFSSGIKTDSIVTSTAATFSATSSVADGGTAIAHKFNTSVALANTGAKLASWQNNSVEKAYFDWNGALVANGGAEFGGTLPVTRITGAQIGIAGGFPGVWLLGSGNTPSTNNYVLLNAGPTLLNASTGQTVGIRINNSPVATFDTTTVTYAAGVKQVFDATDSSGTPGAATINKPSGQVAIAAGAASVVVTNSKVSSTSVVLCVVQTADATLTFIKSVVPGSGTFTITGNANATAATKVGFVVFN